jgi:CDP-glycerol glycerophosphotransferase (TagB/SpsB family)
MTTRRAEDLSSSSRRAGRLATLACSLVSFVLPYLLPSARRQVVLTSFHGRGFRGTPRKLFERMVADQRLAPVWLSTEPEIVARLQRDFGPRSAALCHSPTGVLALARARVIVLSHGITDLPWLHLHAKATVLQAFHGLPTKRGEYLADRLSLAERFTLWRRFHRIDRFLSSSEFVSRLYGARFGLRPEAFVELGYPAYDELFDPRPTLSDKLATLWAGLPEHQHLVLYAPTFRKKATTRFFPFEDFSPAVLVDFLETTGTVVLLRPHPNDRLAVEPLLGLSPRLVLVDDRTVEDATALLPFVHSVVTDYSAIYLEGLLLDLPCVFLPYDRGQYERGLAFDYDLMTPGPKVASFADFVAALRESWETPDHYRIERGFVRRLFFASADGGSTLRMVDWLCRHLGVPASAPKPAPGSGS